MDQLTKVEMHRLLREGVNQHLESPHIYSSRRNVSCRIHPHGILLKTDSCRSCWLLATGSLIDLFGSLSGYISKISSFYSIFAAPSRRNKKVFSLEATTVPGATQ